MTSEMEAVVLAVYNGHGIAYVESPESCWLYSQNKNTPELKLPILKSLEKEGIIYKRKPAHTGGISYGLTSDGLGLGFKLSRK